MHDIKALWEIDRSVAIPFRNGIVEQPLMIFISEVVWTEADNATWIVLSAKLGIRIPADMLMPSVTFIINRIGFFSLLTHAR